MAEPITIVLFLQTRYIYVYIHRFTIPDNILTTHDTSLYPEYFDQKFCSNNVKFYIQLFELGSSLGDNIAMLAVTQITDVKLGLCYWKLAWDDVTRAKHNLNEYE